MELVADVVNSTKILMFKRTPPPVCVCLCGGGGGVCVCVCVRVCVTGLRNLRRAKQDNFMILSLPCRPRPSICSAPATI